MFKGGDQRLDLSNSGTEVFVDVLTLAVSDLAEDPWDYRFAALLTLQDQSVMGRGAVGFDLEDIDWGATPHERARAKGFVLRTAASSAGEAPGSVRWGRPDVSAGRSLRGPTGRCARRAVRLDGRGGWRR